MDERGPTGRPTRGRRTRSWTRKALVALAATLVAAALTEVGYRLVCRARGTPYAAADTRRELLHVTTSMNRPVPVADGDTGAEDGDADDAAFKHVLHPYFGFELPFMVERTARQVSRADAEGRAGRFEVLVVGGSVAALFARHAGEELARLLEADPRLDGRRVVVLNQGRGSFKQPQQQALVAYLLALGLEPDAILNVDGFNEVALGSHNAALGVHPLHPHWPRWGHLAGAGGGSPESVDRVVATLSLQREASALAERTLELGAHRSAVLGRLVARRLYALRDEWYAAKQGYLEAMLEPSGGSPLRGPGAPGSAGEALDVIVRCWTESSAAIDALCDRRAIAYLHVLQPTLHDEGSKPMTVEERAKGALQPAQFRSVRDGYPRLRAAAEVLREDGVRVFDASRLFADVASTLYTDACHFDAEGNARLARAIAPELLAALPPE
jgi:hypothetical protein